MADHRKMLEKLKFKNNVTILNSGNARFDADVDDPDKLEDQIAVNLEKTFGFPVPTIIRDAETIRQLHEDDPFRGVAVTKDIRLYVSLLKQDVDADLKLPWTSKDGSFRIVEKRDKMVLSILDLAVSKTPKAMDALEKNYGKDITTRNWKTIVRVMGKL